MKREYLVRVTSITLASGVHEALAEPFTGQGHF